MDRLGIGSRMMLAVSIVVLVVFAAFILYFQSQEHDRLTKTIGEQVSDVGALATESISNWVSGRRLLMENVAQSFAGATTEEDFLTVLTKPGLQANFVFSYIGTGAGAMHMVPGAELPSDYDPRTRPWYKDASAAGKTTLTEPYEDASTKDLIVTVATPALGPDGKLIGVVGGDLAINTLADIVRSIDLGGIGYGFLVNRDGTVLIHPDAANTLKPMTDVFPGNTPSISTGTGSVVDPGGDLLFAFFKVSGLPTVEWYLGLAIDRGAAYAPLNDFTVTAVGTAVIAVLAILVLLGLLVRQWVARPILSMTSVMTDLAGGKLDLTVPYQERRDEIGSMAGAVQVFQANARENIKLQEDARRLEREAEEKRKAALLETANRFESEVKTSLDGARSATETISSSAASVLGSVATASDRNKEASDSAVQVESNFSTVASAVEELSASIREISNQAQSSRSVCQEAEDKAKGSVSNMAQLQGTVSKITEIGALIQDIAEQTNLLALNATIEAARAGEAGKGFAVVANEVKSLASQTAKATEEIARQVNEVQEHTRASAGEIDQVSQIISNVNGIIGSIAAAVEEQNAATQEISRAVGDASVQTSSLRQGVGASMQAAEESRKDAEKSQANAKELAEKFAGLTSSIDKFLAGIRS